MSRRFRRQAKMSSRFHRITRAAAIAAMLALASPAFAQSDDADAEMRIQQLENQLRQLTGQNEELQYRNRQLEERLRLLQGGAQAAPGAQPAACPSPASPRLRRCSPARPTGSQQTQPGYEPQIAAPAPIVQEPQGAAGQAARPAPRRCLRSRARIPNAPGAPRALGGGQLPIPAEAPVGAPGGRGPGEPLDLANTGGARNPRRRIAAAAAAVPAPARALTTLPPSATPKDEFDLGIGYMQRKDYALAEETMRNFAQKYPSDPLMADSQYWLGESFFQRQQYRDAAEAFLGGDHQIRQIGEGPGRPAAARPVAGGAEGEGSRLRRARRGDAEISARLGRRQSRRRP